MFERYSRESKQTIYNARLEAQHSGSSRIEPQHVLLGLSTADPNLMTRLQVNSQVLRTRVRKTFPSGPPSTSKELMLDDRAKRSLAYAAEAFTHDNRGSLTTGHILLGLLRENKSLGRYVGASWMWWGGIPQQIQTVCRGWQNS